jgi:AcrR family transcriptional regulator
MNKKPEQTELTKKNFGDAFWKLYMKKSIDKITVKDLCDLARYNRSTFYQYFTDVYDLLHQFQNKILEDMNEFLIRLAIETKSSDMSQAMKSFFESIGKYDEYIAILFGPHGDAEFTHKVIENLKPLWIQYYFKTDEYSPSEIDLLMEYHISGVLAMYQKWLFNQNDIPIERFIELAIHTIPSIGVFDNFGKLI